MKVLTEELKVENCAIRLFSKGAEVDLNNGSKVVIQYYTEDSEEYIDESNPDLLVDIINIKVNLFFGEDNETLSFEAKFNQFKSKWKLKLSRVFRVSGLIFPHEIEINLDSMEIYVLFDVYS
jgi:hypothetical protein